MPAKQDLTGKKFGYWEVLKDVGDRKYECTCTLCGNTYDVYAYKLKNGTSTMCRKCADTLSHDNNREKLEGTDTGYLYIEKYLGNSEYLCRCRCGNTLNVSTYNLKRNITKQCKQCLYKNNSENKREKLEFINNREDISIINYIGKSYYKCKCKCGKIINVHAYTIRTNNNIMCTECYKKQQKEHYRTVMLQRYNEVSSQRINKTREAWQIDVLNNKDKLNSLIHELKLEIRKEITKYASAIYNNKSIIYPEELDIYIPDKKLAIEANGTYWHSSQLKDKKYHQEKTIACAKQGIQLIHIFEHEWNNNIQRDKIISLLKRKLDNSYCKTIYARNCKIQYVDKTEAKEFIDKYHLQGYSTSKINIGLYNKNELLGIMTFGKPRFNNDFEYELIRLVYKDNINVIGGTEKMFSHFIKKFKPKNIITYCDISKFTGNIYLKLGFKTSEKHITKPNYVWVEPISGEVLHRYKTTKNSLIKYGFGNESQSEYEIMTNLGYYQLYDSGNLRFEWYNND